MRGSLPRLVAIVVILAITSMVVSKILFGGPHPQSGKCVDVAGELVGCGERAALYELVREVDDGRDCPSESRKLYRFRSSLYCGVALHGAPAPSGDVVPCLLLAGAQLARRSRDLAFARGAGAGAAASDAPVGASDGGVVKVRGDGWRIFYVLSEGQLDPGPAAVVANPAKVAFVAYLADAARQRREVAAATRCARGERPAA
ncbi:MAG TPA: hypothetical protein VGO80_21385 [Solirubrobacteraceae bacterium]|jgi:hypothetical protein|nr:hypothetical protein [Solirubrobacteraceae bacterium]